MFFHVFDIVDVDIDIVIVVGVVADVIGIGVLGGVAVGDGGDVYVVCVSVIVAVCAVV